MEPFLVSTQVVALAEIGDRTQLLANVPAVFLGRAATTVVPLRWVRFGAAVIFVGLGIWTMVAALAS